MALAMGADMMDRNLVAREILLAARDLMAMDPNEQIILQAIRRGGVNDNYTLWKTFEWIHGGLISNTGQFMIVGMKDAKFVYRDHDDMEFTAKVSLTLAPNYDKVVVKTYKWFLKGTKYSGRIS
jgi:hypothetical protein